MHTESEIRRAIRPLLDLYGELNTSEVKDRLNEVMTFDEEDLEMSQTRHECKIMQRIGNIVAHQADENYIYQEGFAVDKSVVPALFYLVTGLTGDMRPLPKELRQAKKHKAEINKLIRKANKVDWNSINEKRNELGALGEIFVWEYERDRVFMFDANSVSRVIRLSSEQGDGLGYDISSIDSHGRTIFIEVKTTEGKENTPFYMTSNERSFFEENKESAFLYRVYDFNKESGHGMIKIIPADELLNDYIFDPTTFRVYKRETVKI